MRTRLTFLTLVSVALGACASASSTGPVIDYGNFNTGSVDVLAEGGFGALSIHHLVRHDDHYYLTTQGSLCGPTCQAPRDSASGTLSTAAVDSLFAVVISAQPASLQDDYGITPNSADMMSYTLRISFNGSTRTVHADDGTMPPPMRRIVDAVRATISAARH